MKTETTPLNHDEHQLVLGGTEHWLFENVGGTWRLVAIGGRQSGKIVREFSSEQSGRDFIQNSGIHARERV